MTRADLLARLAVRRDEFAKLHAHVEAAVLLEDVIAMVEQVDGADIARHRDLTTREAAELLGLDSHRTVERYCRAGALLGAFKTSGDNGDWRIPQTAIDAFRRGRDRGNGRSSRT